MNHTKPAGPLVALAALLCLLPATLLADESTAPLDDDPAFGTVVLKAAGDADADDVYVVHDEVFVDESAPEIPGSSTIAAKLPLSLAETPLAIDTIDAAAFESRDAQVLGDALEHVAGVNVQSGNGIFDAFSLRGLDTTANSRILIDGVPEPQSAFFQLYNVERVEVVKGPVSLLYGASSMGGAINLVRKQPRAGNSTSFGFSGGSFATWQSTVDANYFDDSERWGMRINAQWWQSDLARDRPAQSVAVNPSFTFRAGERTSVHFSLEYVDTDARPDSGLPLMVDFFDPTAAPAVAPVSRRETYDAPFSRSEQDVYRFQVDVETRVNENLVLRNKTYYRSLDWLSDTTSLDAVFPDLSRFDPFNPQATPLVVSRTQLSLDDSQAFTGNQFEVLWRLGSGQVRHNLLFGLELARMEDQFTFSIGALPFIDLFAPVETAQGAFPLFGFGTDAESTVVAPYVIDQIHFSDKFQLLLGLRYDDIDFEDAALGLTRDDSQASPMIGAVFSPSERISVYFNAGQAFSPQSTFVVGESRDPEESEQVELGLRATSAGGSLRASLAVFRLDRDNVAIPDQTGVTQQTGSQRNEGVELEVTARPRQGLSATLTYAWTEAELTEFRRQDFFQDPATGQIVPVTVDLSGNAAAWVPENLLTLWLSQELAGGWGAALGGRWVDEQFISEDNAFAIDDCVMVDAALWYGERPWRLQVNLDNLTDEDTFTRVFSGSSVIPAPGFTARAGIRFGV